MHRIWKWIAALLIALLVAGCSLATVAYNNAPNLMLYALDDYFDLTPAQENWLKPRLDRLAVWHRSTELPAYRQLLDDANRHVAGGARPEHARALYAGARQRLEHAADHALPDMADFLVQLEPRQITRLESKLAADNQKMEKEVRLSLERLQHKRAEKWQERFEDWLGALSPAQVLKIHSAVSTMRPQEAMRLKDRKRRQAEFIATLRAAPTSSMLHIDLRRMLLQPELGRDAADQLELDRQLDTTMTLVADVLAESSPAQRARVQRRLHGYAEDIHRLLRAG